MGIKASSDTRARVTMASMRLLLCALAALRCITVAAHATTSASAINHPVNWSLATRDSDLAPWTSASFEHATPQACPFDALHIAVQWTLSQDATQALARTLVREMRLARQLEPLAEDEMHPLRSTLTTTIRSTFELLAEPPNSELEASVVATSSATERVPSSALSDSTIKHLERLVAEHTTQDSSNNEDALACEFDREFCAPKLIGIRLPDIVAPAQSLAVNHSIVLEFAQPTNCPKALTTRDIEQFVRFSEYVGDKLTGEWSDGGRVLKLRVLAIDDTKLKPLDALMHGLLQTTLQISVDASADDDGDETIVLAALAADDGAALSVTDTTRFRIEPTGRYRVRLSVVASVSSDVLFTAESPLVEIATCPQHAATTVLLQSALAQPTQAAQAPVSSLVDDVPTPSFALAGVLTLAGNEGFVLPHRAIRVRDAGSWSLSFWVLTTEQPTGRFRSLVFNGDGTRDLRTPSAWWHPEARRLVVRASTQTSKDAGVDSTQELPVNEWVHLAFRFRNCSTVDGRAPEANNNSSSSTIAGISDRDECADARSADPPWHYAISLFVNGVKDVDVRFDIPAIASTGPLHVGNGPWTDGMRGFVSRLATFSTVLSDAQIRSQYEHERLEHWNFAPLLAHGAVSNGDQDDVALTRVSESPALQIAYVLQRLSARQSDSALALSLAPLSDIRTLQDRTYADAMRILSDACDASGYDVLLEAAELGHAQALRDVGEAHLYGALALPASCAESTLLVRQDFVRARESLKAALTRGAFDAAKPLALFVAATALSPLASSNDNSKNVPLANLTLGLYHVAAMAGRKDAFAVLARRYAMLDDALETTVYHYYHAALDASVAYHELGKQPLHEMHRLYDALTLENEDIGRGQRGDDDALIQFQKLRAEQGDIDAIAAMGDLYYWGARGLTRDHERAYAYFARAAEAGHVSSQSALAGMLLKGEGVKQDNASAIAWYERAAQASHTRALNGLGFVHFYGSGGLIENKTHALGFFERAAANDEDGDSVFNAGYCHAFGLGTGVNVTRAMAYYDRAATKFGHFDAILELGKLWANGVVDSATGAVVVERDVARALPYLRAASDGGGRWGSTVRRGFDLFLADAFDAAAVRYHEAEELGYTVATSNLAFLYDQRLLHASADSGDTVEPDSDNIVAVDHGGSSTWREVRALAYLMKTSRLNNDTEVLVRIGDYHFYGHGGLRPNAREAMRWYSRASAAGVNAGAYSVGYMHEFGVGVPINLDRAERYYARVLELGQSAPAVTIVVRVALARIAVRKWLERHAPALVTSSFGQLAQAEDAVANATDAAPHMMRLPFSELGGFGLETLWFADWSNVSALMLTLALVVCGVAVVRRSRA